MMYANAQWINDGGQHTCIRCDINGVTSFVPASEDNGDYTNIMFLFETGKLIISPAAVLDQAQSLGTGP